MRIESAVGWEGNRPRLDAGRPSGRPSGARWFRFQVPGSAGPPTTRGLSPLPPGARVVPVAFGFCWWFAKDTQGCGGHVGVDWPSWGEPSCLQARRPSQAHTLLTACLGREVCWLLTEIWALTPRVLAPWDLQGTEPCAWGLSVFTLSSDCSVTTRAEQVVRTGAHCPWRVQTGVTPPPTQRPGAAGLPEPGPGSTPPARRLFLLLFHFLRNAGLHFTRRDSPVTIW